MLFEVLSETDTLQIEAVIIADSLEEAKTKAKEIGFGKNYRVEEAWEG